MAKHANFKLGYFALGIRIEYNDLHHRHAQLPQRSRTASRSNWLLKSPLVVGGSILWQPR